MRAPHPFDEIVRRPEHNIRLAEAALYFALDHCPGLNALEWLTRLDELAHRVERMAAKSGEEQVAAMRAVLVEEEGYSGNSADYHDPRNSFLNEVIERRLGIPISLSAIWLDVARALGWPFHGVGLPGHYLIRRVDAEGEIIIDPYGGGRILTRSGCVRLLSHPFGRQVGIEDSAFDAFGTKATLMRMLNNLHGIYTRQAAWSEVFCTLARMLALEPDSEAIKEQLAMVGVKIAELN